MTMQWSGYSSLFLSSSFQLSISIQTPVTEAILAKMSIINLASFAKEHCHGFLSPVIGKENNINQVEVYHDTSVRHGRHKGGP